MVMVHCQPSTDPYVLSTDLTLLRIKELHNERSVAQIAVHRVWG